MKKKTTTLLILILTFLFSTSFKNELYPINKNLNAYGPWQKVSCFKGLQYRTVRGRQEANGKYWWSVQFRNLYDIATDFNYNIIEPSRIAEVRKNNEILDYWKLSANSDPEKEGSDSPHAGNYVNSADEVYVFITNVRQPVNGNWDVPYKKCDY